MMPTTLGMLRHVFEVYSARSLDLRGLFVLKFAARNRKCLTKKVCFEVVVADSRVSGFDQGQMAFQEVTAAKWIKIEHTSKASFTCVKSIELTLTSQ